MGEPGARQPPIEFYWGLDPMTVIDEVKGRLDVVETISSYVQLQKAGRNFKANCPFHTEKTPSFIVNPERQSWRCFGACATGGDVFSFVMRVENLEFSDALRLLAQKAGVSLASPRDSSKADALYGINQVAVRYYRDVADSIEGRNALKYLDDRGVDRKTMETFGLGLSKRSWDGLKTHLLALGHTEELAVEAGLLHRAEDGSTRDFFRGRLMFPIWDRGGKVLGFGAREMDGSQPKYLNTPQTAIFNKRGTLYGLHMASGAIREQDTVVVVEGYMDVIAAHQHGYANVVASMGTALTDQQVGQLRSMATNYVLALDPDNAGQQATLRSLESSWRAVTVQSVRRRGLSSPEMYRREPLSLKIAALPPGKDPDNLIREAPDEWKWLIKQAVQWLDFYIPAMAARYDLTSGQGKAQAVEALFPLVASAGNHFDQERYFQKLAETLGVTETSLRASIGSPRPTRQPNPRRSSQTARQPRASESALTADLEGSLEVYTLGLLLRKPELKEQAMTFSPENFRRIEHREVFTRWLACTTIGQLEASLDEALIEHLHTIQTHDVGELDSQKAEIALTQCLSRLERLRLQEVQEALLQTEETGSPPSRDLGDTIASINSRMKHLFAQNHRRS